MQKLYSGAAYRSYAAASPAGSPATMTETTSLIVHATKIVT